jgi:YD repeat-containing protein
LNRLTGYGSNGGATSEGYTYDAVGNRTVATLNGTGTTYTCATTSNGLTTLGTAAYGYDAIGNQTSAPSTTYTYDVFGRLASTVKSGVSTTYALNGLA